MKARKRFLAVVIALVLGIGVVLPGFALYGDVYDYSITNEYANVADNGQEQYVAKDANQENENDVYEVAPALLNVAQFGANHFVSTPAELSIILHNLNSGDAITLMNDITFTQRIRILSQNITMVTNGFTLDVQSLAGAPALQVSNGALLLDDSNGGEFNVIGHSGVDVLYGTAEVTNVTSTVGDGIFANFGGFVYVRGNVVASGESSAGARAQNGGVISVDGDVASTGARSTGAYATSGGVVNIGGNVYVNGIASGSSYNVVEGVYAHGVGSVVTVGGNVTSYGEWRSRVRGYSVQASDGANVVVNGDVVANGHSSWGARASGANSFVNIKGDVTSYYSAVFVENGGVIVIEGNTTAIGRSIHMTHNARVAYANGINSRIHIKGDVISPVVIVVAVVASGRAEITIDGNITVDGAIIFHVVLAFDGGVINVSGNVLILSTPHYVVFASGANSAINISGDIISRFTQTSAIGVTSSGVINVGGNVTTNGTGAFASNGGYIRISGALTSAGHVRFDDMVQTPDDYVTPTTRTGYFTFTNNSIEPIATVWIRGNPTTTTLTTATPSLPRTGGNSLITLTGSDLGAADIRIAAFLNNTGYALYTQTPTITTTQATATLNFPENTTDSTRNYTIKVSLDSGTTWLTTPTTIVTVSTIPPSNDTTLSALYTAPGIISPAFDQNILEYTVNVGAHVTTVNISAIANCPYATATVTGYNLTYGQNTVSILVTAQDGTTYTHTFTINVTHATAVVRFHMYIPGMVPYIEIGLSETNTTIPAYLRPTIPLRDGTPGNPGWAFLGWYEELFPNMHNYMNPQNRITHAQRLEAIDLLSNLVITDAMLDDNNVFELHASWLQYGDISGDGIVDPLDRALLQNRIMGNLTDDDMVMQTANLDKNEAAVGPTDRSLLQNHILGVPGIILPWR